MDMLDIHAFREAKYFLFFDNALPFWVVVATSGRILWRVVYRLLHRKQVGVCNRTTGQQVVVKRTLTPAEAPTLCRLVDGN
jgi:hypothetical protein